MAGRKLDPGAFAVLRKLRSSVARREESAYSFFGDGYNYAIRDVLKSIDQHLPTRPRRAKR